MNGLLKRLLITLTLSTLARGAEPTTRPELVFTGDQVTIPMLRAGEYFLVRARVNDQDAGLFVVDTGASNTLLDTKLAQSLGLPRVGESRGRTLEGMQAGTVFAVQSLAIGGAVQRNTFAFSMDMQGFVSEFKVPINGMLGGEFLAAAPFRFSPRDATLTFYRREAFTPPGAPRSELRVVSRRPAVRTSIGQAMSGWFLLDTGANDTMRIHQQFARLHFRELDPIPWTRELSVGMAGVMVEDRIVDLDDIQAMGAKIDRTWAEYSFEGEPGSVSFSGHLGMALLRRFDMTMDYQGESIWAGQMTSPQPAEWDREGFDPKSTDLAGMNALMRAAGRGWTEQASKFLAAGVDVKQRDLFGYSALHRAAGKGNDELVRAFLAAGADPNAAGDRSITPLQLASGYGKSVGAVEALLAAGAQVNARDSFGRTALILAAENGNADIARALIRAGADVKIVSPRSGTALHAAATRGSVEIAAALLDGGADVNATMPPVSGSRTILAYAANNGRNDVLSLLIARGADVNAVDGNRQTALIGAAIGREPQSIRLLLAAGADRNILDKSGKSALDYALLSSDVEVISQLYSPVAAPTTRP